MRRQVAVVLCELFISLVVLTGCAGASSQGTQPPTAVSATAQASATAAVKPTAKSVETCQVGTPMDFANWQSWTKVNEKPIQGHELWVNVYLNDAAKEPYLAAAAPMPVCSMIVKEHLSSESSTDTQMLTVMVKMSPGYDPQHGDWWYARYAKDGIMELEQGKIDVCIACHLGAAADDYLFATQVLEKAGE